MSYSIVSLAESAKSGSISVKPFFDPNRSNLGLEKYGLSLFDGVFHEEQLACLDRNGIRRYLTGLNEFAPEVKLIKDNDEREAKIQEIRKVYKGKLTYAANWDEYKRITFWNQLDYIGIDAYFPLTDKKSPTIEEFELGWQTHKNEIKKVQSQFKKPILFTEYGYRSIDFTGKKPWESNRTEGSVNLEAQKNGLQAIHNQFWKEEWFVGGFLWKWFHTHDRVGGLNNNRFTPQNKPAELLIQQLYKTN